MQVMRMKNGKDELPEAGEKEGKGTRGKKTVKATGA